MCSYLMAISSDPALALHDRAFFGHPRGLSTLFFTEMWERFSYYGMRALLILFMTAAPATGGLGFDAMTAGAIYGLYTAMVYEGPGIARDVLPRIFDPFFTTKRTGSGLGLAIAKNIVEGLGGTIAIGSEPSRGTTVRITLPREAPRDRRQAGEA